MKTIRMSSSQFRESLHKPRSNRSNTGKPFEREIESACRYYQEQGIALIEKVEPPTRIVGERVIYLRNPFLDFVGSIHTSTGVSMITFEAKSTSKPRLPICPISKSGAEVKHGLTLSQWETMKRWRDAGAIVFLLWKYEETTSLITYRELYNAIMGKKKSICWGDCGFNAGWGFLDAILKG